MGVPRLFKWLFERYPLILRTATAQPKPLFDNLYLDFNGIIHNCSRTSTDGQLTDMHRISAIYAYLERIFSLIEPRKVLFLAIDGVAPRAKMNQQRQRRLRTAVESARLMQETKLFSAITGVKVDETQPVFDSNCITPGTEFMEKLEMHLLYFIKCKVETDLKWRNVRVVLSGHLTPGEGEHKIMDFIRQQKTRPDYDPNTSHCLYGLDADLMMLGLASHEPHFCILREQVLAYQIDRFANVGDTRKEVVLDQNEDFQLLYLGLLREYLDMEFRSSLMFRQEIAVRATKLEYDLERTIDDFVFLVFLVGNDFLPTLPTADIDEGGLEHAFALYSKIREQRGEHLVETAKLQVNVHFMTALLDEFSSQEERVLAKRKTLKRRHPVATRALLTAVAAGKEDELDELLAEPGLDDDETSEIPPATQAEPITKVAPRPPVAVAAAKPTSATTTTTAPAKPNAWMKPAVSTDPSVVVAAPSAPAVLQPELAAVQPQQHSSPSQFLDPAILSMQAPSVATVPSSSQPETTEATSKKKSSGAASSKSGFDPKLLAFTPSSLAPPKSKDLLNKKPLPAASPTAFVSMGGPMMMRPLLSPQMIMNPHQLPPHFFGLPYGMAPAPGHPALLPMRLPQPGSVLQPAEPAPAPAQMETLQPTGASDTEQAVPAESAPASEVSVESPKPAVVKRNYRDIYYDEKFLGLKRGSDEHKHLIASYVRGLQWVLEYYYSGVPSWDWYFPFHFAPLPSDLAEFASLYDPSPFAPSAPLPPFLQLLAVLPTASQALLPPRIGKLMADPSVAPYYETEVPVIPDDLGREWKNVALVPFIDIEKLQTVYDVAVAKNEISENESRRNVPSDCWLLRYDGNAAPVENKSIFAHYPTISVHVSTLPFVVEPIRATASRDYLKLPAGVWTGNVPPPAGFPTTKTLTYTPTLVKRKYDRMSLLLELPNTDELIRTQAVSVASNPKNAAEIDLICKSISHTKSEQLAKMLVGNTCCLDYPYHTVGKVLGVHDAGGVWKTNQQGQIRHYPHEDPAAFEGLVEQVVTHFQKSGGVLLSHPHVIVEAAPLECMTRTPSGATRRHFSEESHFYPADLIPTSAPRKDARYEETGDKDPSQRFPIGTKVIYLGASHYGDVGVVSSYDASQKRFGIDLNATGEWARQVVQSGPSPLTTSTGKNYTSSSRMATALDVSLANLNRFLTSFGVVLESTGQMVDIGLNLKNSRRQILVPGHVQCTKNAHARDFWTYSVEVFHVLKEARDRFPSILSVVLNEDTRHVPEETLFPATDRQTSREQLLEVLAWRRSLPFASAPFTKIGSSWLAPADIARAEAHVDAHRNDKIKIVHVEATVQDLLEPSTYGLKLPDEKRQSLSLGTRVVNTVGKGQVPFGVKGTVCFLTDESVAVVWDSVVLSGRDLFGRCSASRATIVNETSLLNISQPALVSKASKAAVTAAAAASEKSAGGTKKKAPKAKIATNNPFELLMDQ